MSEVCDYEFRNLRLRKISRGEKFGHLFESMFSPQILFWFGIWGALMLVTAYKKI